MLRRIVFREKADAVLPPGKVLLCILKRDYVISEFTFTISKERNDVLPRCYYRTYHG